MFGHPAAAFLFDRVRRVLLSGYADSLPAIKSVLRGQISQILYWPEMQKTCAVYVFSEPASLSQHRGLCRQRVTRRDT
jgi:hypothetical protein